MLPFLRDSYLFVANNSVALLKNFGLYVTPIHTHTQIIYIYIFYVVILN
jgi:hypothetical protein